MGIKKEVKEILNKLERKGFQVYLVGGCVRDLLSKNNPKDWDAAANAKPEEILKIFPDSYLDNKFGTVTILLPAGQRLEITPFRKEAKYTDKRHPDKIEWAKTVEEDLSRRDFTINAIALNSKFEIIDLFNGRDDLENKIIKTVGNAEDRFSEDALRMIRAVRLAAILAFKIEEKTGEAIKKNAYWLEAVSQERIRDELVKIIMADKAAEGIEFLRVFGLLRYIIPELERGCEVSQNKHHTFDCYQHAVFSLDYAAKKNFNKYVRLASLLHDIGKPESKRGQGQSATFYGHEIVGAKMAFQILSRLRFSGQDIKKIVKLVRYHLFYYNVGEVSEASVRRLVSKVGAENIDELLQVRMADRIGSGVPKAEPYKLRHLKYIIEKISKDPLSVKKLKINGDEIMKILDIKPGIKIGWILNILLGYVISDPLKNKKPILVQEVKKLSRFSDKELKEISEKSLKEKDNIIIKEDKMTKQKYWVT